MNYNTWQFWLLFAALFLPYWKLGHRAQNRLLLVASYIFYGCWDYRFLFLIFLSTVIDYIGGLGVAGHRLSRRSLNTLAGMLVGSAVLCWCHIRYDRLASGLIHHRPDLLLAAIPHRFVDYKIAVGTALILLVYRLALPHLYAAPEMLRRKWFLTISMVANLAILGFFKYFDFFLGSLQGLLSSLHLSQLAGHTLGLILPAGISFYTFQAMSYTIDIYRGQIEPTESFPDFALFVCFFPHLVAGPIMRAHTLLPQVTHPRELRPGDMEEGLLLVLIGLFKKIVIADNMAPLANAVFWRFSDGTWRGMHGPEVLVGVYAFAFQIYGDFSGYSSIARGISKWLGFELIINFRMPYLAQSPSDFWKRWHISLSTWLRDYLYIPLGGNRKGKKRTYANLMTTMLLGGLWHGANWTFVGWGFVHGLVLCVYRLLGIPDEVSREKPFWRLEMFGRILLMFHLTCLGWVLFRASSFTAAAEMMRVMAVDYRFTSAAAAPLVLIAFYGLVLFVVEWFLDGERRLRTWAGSAWTSRVWLYCYLLFMLIVFPAQKAHEFIYFQF